MEFISLIGELAPVVQVIIVVTLAVIFWKPIAAKLGLKEEDSTPSWAQNLMQYVNHEQTEMHGRTHDKLEKVEDAIKENTRTLQEIQRYGVKCQK